MFSQHIAQFKNDIEIGNLNGVKQSLSKDPSILNLPLDVRGNNAVWIAVLNNQLAILKLLVNFGGNLHLTNFLKASCLDIAIKKGQHNNKFAELITYLQHNHVQERLPSKKRYLPPISVAQTRNIESKQEKKNVSSPTSPSSLKMLKAQIHYFKKLPKTSESITENPPIKPRPPISPLSQEINTFLSRKTKNLANFGSPLPTKKRLPRP